jgi:5-methylcytosine-specific restriction protein A
MHWDIQRSGTQIPDEIAKQLESEWETTRIQSGSFRFPEEIEQTTYPEGAVQRVQVNRYERNPQARRQCIAHYGAQCQICEFDFSETYGEVGVGFIHVHHLREISSLGQDYEVDPTTDLIPVCPNCHAIIHRRKPTYTIEEVRALLRQREISLNE